MKLKETAIGESIMKPVRRRGTADVVRGVMETNKE